MAITGRTGALGRELKKQMLRPVRMTDLAVASWAAVLGVVACGWLFRSRAYGIFRLVLLSIYTLIALPLLPRQGWLGWVAVYFHAAVYLDSCLLIRPRLRPLWYRVSISWPSLYFQAAMLLSFPWAIVAAFGLPPYGAWIPFVLAGLGMLQSLSTRREEHALSVGNVEEVPGLRRVEVDPPRDTQRLAEHEGANQRPLRIIQITDPHLGPFMSVERLKRITRRAAELDPDLVLLTGDFLTMESQGSAAWLQEALRPLATQKGKTFACLGNHDHEAPGAVQEALEAIGARLLVDQATVFHTGAGPVQIVGFDFHFTERAEKMARVCQAFPRQKGMLRLALLHDPGAFRHLPPDEVDLAVSGHTHGGQVGMVSLGHPWTVVGWLTKMPDHGFWARGRSRLYVHRGTGHYGFPLRLGVPAEESVLLVRIH